MRARPRAEFARRAAGLAVVATVLSAPALLASTSARAATLRQYSSSGPAWLRSQLVTPAQLTGFQVIADYSFPVDQVIQGTGSYQRTIRAAALKSAYVRELLSYNGAADVELRLVEYTKHVFTEFPVSVDPGQKRVRVPGLRARDAGALAEQAPAGTTTLYLAFPKGRIRVEILLHYYSSAPGAYLTARSVLVRIANTQLSDLRSSPDIRASSKISLRSLQIRDYVTIVLLTVVVISLASAGAALFDRGSRERLASYLPGSTKVPGSPSAIATVDVSTASRRRLWWFRAGVLLRAAIFLALFTYTYPRSTTLHQAVLFAAIGFFISLAETLYYRLRKRYAFRVPYGWPSLLAGMVGVAVSIGLITGGGVLIWLALIGLTTIQGIPGISEHHFYSFVLWWLATGLFCFAGADIPSRLVRRLWMLRASTILKEDGRPEILLLRSFVDDGILMRRHHSAQQPIIERSSLRRHQTFEEILCSTIWQFGPVRAVAEPGTTLPPLGAARQLLAAQGWQERVFALMRSSRLIVVVVGSGRALLWEIERIRSAGLLGKTVFAFPPLPQAEVVSRIQLLTAALNLDAALLRLTTSPTRLLTLQFDQSGSPLAHVACARDDVAYETAFIQATRRASISAAKMEYPVGFTARIAAGSAEIPPVPSSAGRSSRRRSPQPARWLLAVLAAALVIDVLSHVLVPSKATPVVNLPGHRLGVSDQFGLLCRAGSGRLAGIADNGDELVLLTDSGKIIWETADLRLHTRGIASDGTHIFVTTQKPDEVVAWHRDGSGYRQQWVHRLPSATGQMVVLGNRLAVALPGLDEVVILNTNTGFVEGTPHVAGSPWPMAVYKKTILVGSVSGYDISWLDPRSDKIVRIERIGTSPSSLLVAGNRLLISSIMGDSILVASLSPVKILSRIPLRQLGGVMGVTDGKLFAGTYNKRPQLVEIDLRSYRRQQNWFLSSQVYALIADGRSLFVDLPQSESLTELRF